MILTQSLNASPKPDNSFKLLAIDKCYYSEVNVTNDENYDNLMSECR